MQNEKKSSLKRVIPFFFSFFFWIICLLQKQGLDTQPGKEEMDWGTKDKFDVTQVAKLMSHIPKNKVNVTRKLRHYYFKWVFVNFNFTNYVKLLEVVSQGWTYSEMNPSYIIVFQIKLRQHFQQIYKSKQL